MTPIEDALIDADKRAGPKRPLPIGDWTRFLIRNGAGTIRPMLANAITALKCSPEWNAVLGYDEFASRTVALKATPWDREPHIWADAEDIRTADWLQRHGIQVSRDIAGQAVQVVSLEWSFHPVREYLESLKWDGVSRVGRWLQIYLGAVMANYYTSAIGERWLISAVARIFQPGCKADHCLILEGSQGIGKSSALRALAGKWFADEIADLGSKDAAMQTRGIWILEIAELDAMSRSETSRIKSFISRSIDHYRPPYGKHVVNLPRQAVFVGTVNHTNYLRDETGGRRFWPATCGQIDLDALTRDRDQIWAEAVVKYRDGRAWWIDSQELTNQAAIQQAERYEGDSWDEMISEWAAARVAIGADSISIPEVLDRCLQKKKDQWNRGDEIRVARSLRSAGWERFRIGTGNREWRYKKIETEIET